MASPKPARPARAPSTSAPRGIQAMACRNHAGRWPSASSVGASSTVPCAQNQASRHRSRRRRLPAQSDRLQPDPHPETDGRAANPGCDAKRQVTKITSKSIAENQPARKKPRFSLFFSELLISIVRNILGSEAPPNQGGFCLTANPHLSQTTVTSLIHLK